MSALPAPRPTPLGRAARLGVIALVIGGALALGLPLCPFAIITRHPCPGCGLTRAAFALAHGHVGEALRLHPLSVVLVPAVVAALGLNALGYLREGRVAAAESLAGRRVTAVAIALGAAAVIVWIARFFGAFGGPVPV